MNELSSYNFDPYKERALEKVRRDFKEKIKHTSFIDPQDMAAQTLESFGFPLDCPLKEVLLSWIYKIINFDFLNEQESFEEILLFNNQKYQVQGKERANYEIDALSEDDYQLSLEFLAQRNHIEWNYARPFASFLTTLGNHKVRATLCHHSMGPTNQSRAFFRKLEDQTFSLSSFNLTDSQTSLIHEMIKEQKNILVAGPTGSGKTSFLKSLIKLTPPSQHIITLEDTHELILKRENTTSLLANDSESHGLEQYCAYALRMKPDRLVLGEMRSKEVVPFLLASNTGHKGLMASLHANSAVDAIGRVALLFQIYSDQKGINYQEILKLVCQGIDCVVSMNDKRITEIIQVLGCEGHTPYYQRLEC